MTQTRIVGSHIPALPIYVLVGLRSATQTDPHPQTHTTQIWWDDDHSVKKDFYNQRDKSKIFTQILMINKEIHFQKRHRSRLHSLHSYLHTRIMLQEQSVENVVIHLNQEMADNMVRSLVLNWASVVQRKACGCLCGRNVIIWHQKNSYLVC